MGFDAFLADVARQPTSAGLFSDFDGTLAQVVARPAIAVPVVGVVERIDELSTLLGRVAIVSGRPLDFLDGLFSPRVELSGLYGIEHSADGVRRVDEDAVEWRPVVARTIRDAVEEFGQGVVEDKTFSLTLHYRGESDDSLRNRIERWTSDRADLVGLQARPARMSVELHPPVALSKADALDSMLTGLTSVAYLGDDVGDRPAFQRLGQLVDSGALTSGAGVLVASEETPPELRPLATDLADGPEAVVALLDRILNAARP